MNKKRDRGRASKEAFVRLIEFAEGKKPTLRSQDVLALVRIAYIENERNLREIAKIWMATSAEAIEKFDLNNPRLHHAIVSHPNTSKRTKEKVAQITKYAAIKHMAR